MKPGHPPVVIISSVPREDANTAFECLKLGAVDYIEKPTLSDLTQRMDEIRTKVRCAAAMGETKNVSSDIDRSFKSKFTIAKPETKLRLIFAGPGDRNKLVVMSNEMPSPQPPTVVVMEGATGIFPAIKQVIETASPKKVELLDGSPQNIKPEMFYLADFKASFDALKRDHASRPCSIIVLGDISRDVSIKIRSWTNAHLIMEDIDREMSANHKEVLKTAKYFVPFTSIAYHSNEFLSKVGSGGK